jgi:hypothetical protein
MKKALANQSSLTRMATAAMRDAIAEVIEDHRRRRMPLSVWEDGKVVFIQPEDALAVRETSKRYRVRPRRKKS